MRDINADTTTAAIAGSADAAAAAAASAAAASIPSLKHTGDLGGDAGEDSETKSEAQQFDASSPKVSCRGCLKTLACEVAKLSCINSTREE